MRSRASLASRTSRRPLGSLTRGRRSVLKKVSVVKEMVASKLDTASYVPKMTMQKRGGQAKTLAEMTDLILWMKSREVASSLR